MTRAIRISILSPFSPITSFVPTDYLPAFPWIQKRIMDVWLLAISLPSYLLVLLPPGISFPLPLPLPRSRLNTTFSTALRASSWPDIIFPSWIPQGLDTIPWKFCNAFVPSPQSCYLHCLNHCLNQDHLSQNTSVGAVRQLAFASSRQVNSLGQKIGEAKILGKFQMNEIHPNYVCDRQIFQGYLYASKWIHSCSKLYHSKHSKH